MLLATLQNTKFLEMLALNKSFLFLSSSVRRKITLCLHVPLAQLLGSGKWVFATSSQLSKLDSHIRQYLTEMLIIFIS